MSEQQELPVPDYPVGHIFKLREKEYRVVGSDGGDDCAKCALSGNALVCDGGTCAGPRRADDRSVYFVEVSKEDSNEYIYEQALNKWGFDSQILLTIEELAELQVELAKLLNGRIPATNIITEMADVEIMLEQLKVMYGFRQAVENEKQRKLMRLKHRINGGENNAD